MKLSGGKADAFIKNPPMGIKGILLFGPDAGLVRERGKSLCKFYAGDDAEFSIHELTGDAVRKDPAILADMGSALSLMGGEPVVRVRDISDNIVGIIDSWLEGGGGVNPGIFEAGELAPRSKLRQAFEKRKDAAAIGCYPDEGQSLEAVIRQHMRENGVALEQDAIPGIVARLGTDRLAIRQELDKLVLYAGGPNQGGSLSGTDVDAAIGDVKTTSMDELAFAAASGNSEKLAAGLDLALAEGLAPVALLRVVQRHFDRLLLVKSAMTAGEDAGIAMKKLRPPIFFKLENAFRTQVQRWPEADLVKCLQLLMSAERDCKSGLTIDRAVFERSLLQICQVARRQFR